MEARRVSNRTIPAEPAQDGPRTAHVDWPTDTLPVDRRCLARSGVFGRHDDTAALDAIARLGFDQNSPLYQKLVMEDQKVDRCAPDRRPISIRSCSRCWPCEERAGSGSVQKRR